MPKASKEKMIEAEKLFNDGMAMVEIAIKLGVSDGTVRSWKNRYGWGDKSQKNNRNVAKKEDKKNATLQKRKKGGHAALCLSESLQRVPVPLHLEYL